MSALSDAVDANQRRAIQLLGQSYARRTEDPDDGLFQAMLLGIGCTDETEILWLLRCWRVARDEKATPAGEAQGSRAADKEQRPASDAQWARIRADCKKASVEPPQGPLTMRQASDIIEALAAGTYEPVLF